MDHDNSCIDVKREILFVWCRCSFEMVVVWWCGVVCGGANVKSVDEGGNGGEYGYGCG